MSLAREGWPFILGLLVPGAALAFRWPWPGGVLIGLGLFTAFFFRDPEREIPRGDRLVVSPADGKVVRVTQASEDEPCGPETTQVSIFLSLFDVHVNRAPVAGRITSVEHRPGEFLPAFDHAASSRNERNRVSLDSGGQCIAFTQIAGVVARRIVFRKSVGDMVSAGERVGLIRFGSRVDLFLPPDVRLRVKVGDHVRGGSSIIGERVDPGGS